MKTYNGKNISIKQIQKILRTMDKTQIFRLYFQIFGKIIRHDLHFFILKYAPSKRVRDNAYWIAYNNNIPHVTEEERQKRMEYNKATIYSRTISLFRECIKFQEGIEPSRPILGKTYLYFAHPAYGIHDRYKLKVMPIEGNERFCETICKLADKYFN